MSLSKIVEEIKKVAPYVKEDVESGPRETLVGRRGRKAQAIESLQRLRREYKKSLLESAAFIIVTGTSSQEFAATAQDKFGCFVANPDDFYADLAVRIPESLYKGGETLNNLFDIIGRHLEDKASELDILGYPQLIFKQDYRVTLKDSSDLVSLIKRAINEQVGSEIVGIQAIHSLVDTALEKEHTSKRTSVILATNSEVFAQDLQKSLGRLKSSGVFLVVAGKATKAAKALPGAIVVKEVTEESVEQSIKKMGESLKNR